LTPSSTCSKARPVRLSTFHADRAAVEAGLAGNVPLDLLEARNSVAIAKAAGAEQYAKDSIVKAEDMLQRAEDYYQRKQGRTPIGTAARGAVQMAEDARVLTLRRKEEEREAAARKAAADAKAKAEADAEASRQAELKAQAQSDEDARRRAEAEQAQALAALAQQATAQAQQPRAGRSPGRPPHVGTPKARSHSAKRSHARSATRPTEPGVADSRHAPAA
jgi:hypothetical protein